MFFPLFPYCGEKGPIMDTPERSFLSLKDNSSTVFLLAESQFL